MVVYKKKEIIIMLNVLGLINLQYNTTTKNMEIDGISIEFITPNLSMKATTKKQIICFTSRS
jgi:hypothetical protein